MCRASLRKRNVMGKLIAYCFASWRLLSWTKYACNGHRHTAVTIEIICGVKIIVSALQNVNAALNFSPGVFADHNFLVEKINI